MKLEDTVQMMTSADYKERFKAEYIQTKIRHEHLRTMLVKLDAETLTFTPESPAYLLNQQADQMAQYLHSLEVRAEYEKIDLPKIDLVV